MLSAQVVSDQSQTADDDNTCSVHFQVKDTGIGMCQEDLKRLFVPFSQVGQSSAKHEGTGLGLYISSKLLKLLHSEIHVESELGKGSTFKFTVQTKRIRPPTVSTPVEPPTAKLEAQPAHDIRVLVVEDNAINLNLACKYLRKLKVKSVDKATSGELALTKLGANEYDVVFMDISMPPGT